MRTSPHWQTESSLLLRASCGQASVGLCCAHAQECTLSSPSRGHQRSFTWRQAPCPEITRIIKVLALVRGGEWIP